MATFLSDQLTKKPTLIAAGTPLDPTESEGRVRVKHFSWTGDAAQNDTVQLADIPKGARIVSGRVDHTAFGALVDLHIGDGTTAAKYASALDVAAAGQKDFANTVALAGLLSEAAALAFVLTGTLLTAEPVSGTLDGYVMYVVD